MRSSLVASLILALALPLATSLAHAQGALCEAKAADKKLAGAARSSFVKKCLKDAKASAVAACEANAAEKKLYGAAKNSFVKKCEREAVAAATPAPASAPQ